MFFDAQSATLHEMPVHGLLPPTHRPSLVQLAPSPHWPPPAVHDASHLPSSEQ
jgi:hypothetical protein